jgi:meiotically up-regulated gene 157 (Mug157) protein
MIQGLTSNDPSERVQVFRWLLKMQCGNGLMHESVDVNDLSKCTRPWCAAGDFRCFGVLTNACVLSRRITRLRA